MKRWSTVLDFIASGKAPASETVVSFEGWQTKGDGGNSLWVKTGGTDTPSQTPTVRGNNTLTDSAGFIYTPIDGQVFRFNGNAWFPSPFGDSGEGLYQFNGASWDFYDRVENIITTYADTATMQAASPSALGQRAENRERGYAQYELKDLDYVPLPGDITAANGRVWALQKIGGKYVSSHFASFQDAIDRSSSESVALVATGSIDIQSSGNQINSRNYAILLKDNTHIEADLIINCLNDGLLYDAVTNDRVNGNANIKISGSIIINGNNATRPQGGMGVWLERVTGLDVSGLEVNESTAFGFRLNRVSDFIIKNYRCTTTLDQAGDDGLHLYDCDNGLIDGAIIETAGDDCFIISAERVGSHDITAKNLVLKSPTGNRGVLLNLADLADAMYDIKNINIQAVCNDCADGPAALLSQATFENINLDIQSEGCRNAFTIDLPSIGFGEGVVRNSTFNIQSNADLENAIVVNDSGTVENNTLNGTVYNNGDGFESVVLRGTGWSGKLTVDNDPNASKVTPLSCIDMFADNSNMALVVKNADEGLNLRSTAINNNFSITETNCATYSIDNASGLAQCMFTGGKIETPVRLVNDNVFSNVKGATLDNVIEATTDVSGLIDLTHGLVSQPRVVTCSYIGTQTYTVRVSNITSTIVRFGVYDETGAAVASELIKIAYSIKL